MECAVAVSYATSDSTEMGDANMRSLWPRPPPRWGAAVPRFGTMQVTENIGKSTNEMCLTVGFVRRLDARRPLGMMPRGVSHALAVYSTVSGAQCIVEVTVG
jgi:hypothetical protein